MSSFCRQIWIVLKLLYLLNTEYCELEYCDIIHKQTGFTMCWWQQVGVSQKEHDRLMWQFTEKSQKVKSQKVAEAPC